MTLFNLLRAGAAVAPDQPLVIGPGGSVSYRECLLRSEAFGRGLLSRGIRRFAAVIADPAEVIALLSASSATGSEACLFRPDCDAATCDEYVSSFEQPVVIADRQLDSAHAELVPLGDLAAVGGAFEPVDGPSPTLILTTGTTGLSRGVRHDWRRLVASVRGADRTAGARWLLAYNLNQFAGTQILLHVLVTRATLVVPASQQPRDAVTAVRDFSVTHASATPTFWRLFAAHVTPEQAVALPLRQITLGGEAAPSSLLDRLAKLFPDANISQIYAGTEFGSVWSVRDRRSGLPVSLLDRREGADVQLRIENGELFVRSQTSMLGYYGSPDASDGWLATGDLVEIQGDRIVFVGRTTDTINVGGVKVHPLPVEEVVGRVEGVTLARAYAHPNPITGQIVAVDVVARPGVDHAALKRQIREACRGLASAAQPRRINIVHAIDVRGNKIVRRREGS